MRNKEKRISKEFTKKNSEKFPLTNYKEIWTLWKIGTKKVKKIGKKIQKLEEKTRNLTLGSDKSKEIISKLCSLKNMTSKKKTQSRAQTYLRRNLELKEQILKMKRGSKI